MELTNIERETRRVEQAENNWSAGRKKCPSHPTQTLNEHGQCVVCSVYVCQAVSVDTGEVCRLPVKHEGDHFRHRLLAADDVRRSRVLGRVKLVRAIDEAITELAFMVDTWKDDPIAQADGFYDSSWRAIEASVQAVRFGRALETVVEGAYRRQV